MKKRPDFQLLLEINQRLEKEGLDVCMFMNYGGVGMGEYGYLKHLTNGKDNFSININDPIEDIIKASQELSKATFTKVTDLCASLIEETVYIDKDENQPITVKSIPDKNGVLDTNNVYHALDTLYYKT